MSAVQQLCPRCLGTPEDDGDVHFCPACHLVYGEPPSPDGVAMTWEQEQEQLFSPDFAPRSGGWRTVAKHFLKNNPDCAVCGSKRLVVPHHVEPYHIHPDLELDPLNLITLCPPDHLLVGHLKNWRAYNPNVREDAHLWASKITHRPTA